MLPYDRKPLAYMMCRDEVLLQLEVLMAFYNDNLAAAHK